MMRKLPTRFPCQLEGGADRLAGALALLSGDFDDGTPADDLDDFDSRVGDEGVGAGADEEVGVEAGVDVRSGFGSGFGSGSGAGLGTRSEWLGSWKGIGSTSSSCAMGDGSRRNRPLRSPAPAGARWVCVNGVAADT